MTIKNIDNLKCYIGIADSEGIESFLPWDDTSKSKLTFLFFRARFNSQRNAIVYKVFLEDVEILKINELIKKHKYKEALIHLKKQAVEIHLQKSQTKENWDLIPQYSQQEIAEMRTSNKKHIKIKEKKSQLLLFNME
jgi:hypothetical protein